MLQKSSKEDRRKYFRRILKEESPQVSNAIIVQVLDSLKKLLREKPPSGFLGLYWPLPGEIDLREIKTRSNFRVALPATREDGSLTYHQWATNKPLMNDACKIPSSLQEPKLSADAMNLLLVPALSIDRKGFRLGYGGGFYDRLLSNNKWRSVPVYAILPQSCVSEDPLPFDSWDIPFHGWISEKGLTSLIDI